MPPAPATSEMLAEMSACAYRLGLAFGREAERTEEVGRRLEMFQLFDRCFFAVRVATALQLRLRREAWAAPAREPANDAEDLREREPLDAEPQDAESLDAGRPEPDAPGRERLDADRDRDRETERASLPVLLTTLTGVAADAAARPGRPPAALPALQALLARASAEPAPVRRPAGAPPLRDRLAGSAAVAVTAPPRAPSGLRPPVRRATGPPRR
jgi:hypothetical protein